jgi:hypothetical protein
MSSKAPPQDGQVNMSMEKQRHVGLPEDDRRRCGKADARRGSLTRRGSTPWLSAPVKLPQVSPTATQKSLFNTA